MIPSKVTTPSSSLVPGDSDAWGLLGLRFSLREKATATTIGKICGSIITRTQYTSLFDAAQAGFNLTSERLPPWLQDLDFVRSTTVLGENMRRIRLDQTMKDVDKYKLSGLATFVVLCSKYGEDIQNITRMINLLLIGSLGTVISPPDPDQRPNLPYSFKPHVNGFITSCLDADRESDISREVMSQLAELHLFGDLVRVNGLDGLERRRQASLDLMGELLGAPSPEDTMSKHVRKLYQIPENPQGWARVHDTLHLTSAYMAIAAAAHGANVMVECISHQGSKFLPKPLTTVVRHKTFLLRLWLIQPPEDVLGIMRYSSSNTTSTWQDRNEDRFGRDPDNLAPTIFGGQLELAICFARYLGFQHQNHMVKENEELLELWSRASECASHYRWIVQETNVKRSTVRLTLFRPDKDKPISPVAATLCNYLKPDRRLNSISRTVAALVHEYYQFSDYSSFSSKEGESQMTKAMYLVLLAMAVQILRNTINPNSDSPDSYALNVGTLDANKTGLQTLMRMAVSEEGVSPSMLVHTAASVWGGLNPATYHLARPGEAALGVVAPHCCVLLDMIRNPLEFARKGTSGYLLSIWRGAVPMLPRDPNTNLVSGYDDTNSHPFQLTPSFEPVEEAYQKLFSSILITFEPHVNKPTCGVFCVWYGGFLVTEVHPENIMSGLLKCSHATATTSGLSGSSTKSTNTSRKCIILSKADLLHTKHFTVTNELSVIIKTIDDPAWLIFAAGCSTRIPDTIFRECNDELLVIKDVKEKCRGGETVILKKLSNNDG
ncbi:unnamed protein product [Fusarium graminearum]|nr:unnamed protein product [Fusarium graminearum]